MDAGPPGPIEPPGAVMTTAGPAVPVGVPASGRVPEPRPRPADPLDDPDADRVGDTATTEALLRCWVRERAVPRPAPGTPLRLALPATGVTLEVPVRYWSHAGWHRFDPPHLADTTGPELDAVTVAALLGREAPGAAGAARIDTAARVADSARRAADHIRHRRAHPDDPPGTPPFLAAEQALLLGHPLHPTPKSRDGLTAAEAAAYAPELRGNFPLHWFAVHHDLVTQDCTRDTTAAALLAELSDGLVGPTDHVLLPAHPWQARDLAQRPGIRALLDVALLRDLGPFGPAWHPTSSVRTVYRAGAPVMLKLSLGLRITNSRRENLRKEQLRGLEVDRMMRAGLAAELHAAHPGFDILRDIGWLAVDAPRTSGPERAESGLEIVLRDNPFGDRDVVCVAGLVAERPGLGPSRLATLVHALAARTGQTVADTAEEWFARYLAAVADPVLWLDAHAGIALEAHQQNTLVELDADGWPAGGRYRDNQGYYFRASRADDLRRRLLGAGTASDTVVDDHVADERLAYYLGVNNLLGLVGAFGAQGLADEAALLSRLRSALEPHAAAVPAARTLLAAELLRCKGNLMTRLHGLDELVGPVAAQSVYVDIPNPLHPNHHEPQRATGGAVPA
ncbi:IucA/IucC family protein [Yinghuangia seranimata]|uniref:IucA/IucC family protein n=1 Tax=Yinghuangia seranimata TaxID=408067 RepID=UPI00248C538D|nr:IucA/IucC family protein [Yinghuangia seranimata]MDI2128640.1 IucA/IucC family protein [Yinghuangia seranimata]